MYRATSYLMRLFYPATGFKHTIVWSIKILLYKRNEYIPIKCGEPLTFKA